MTNNKYTKQNLQDTPLSVLDLVTVSQGKSPANSFHNSLDLARHVENFGYKRYWLAEHHNSPSVASSATSILIGYIAEGTSTIRVGSGGIMLPNHVPLVVAEQFGTLESLYPGRIDLGLGRAPGTDPITARALRRNVLGTEEDFEENIMELQNYLGSPNEDASVRAIPGEGTNVPIWILGSSLYSARLAGKLGLPYAFASHFAPNYLQKALKLYKESFQPSKTLQEPYSMACVNVIAADTNEEAQLLASSLYLFFLNIIRRQKDLLKPPVENMNSYWNAFERQTVLQQLYYTFIGDSSTIQKELQAFLNDTPVDEIMVCSHIYDHTARVRSYEILSNLVKGNKS
ncbi:LLM class flavin-dependent oxidoreductase [Thermoflavimicrobium daqui]|uniref:LLM class flavin-dependent oxidoreductase n=1 Tax=Thermoflavimicrobium daqui TaxID=2137476 RepID=A0A364K4D3_9BACL|nr:LLM class flavin-dependent oxidoreductase [Thermoflavimicrobium daqui]RAL24151.1 LLM class flavin-dependent oxidoreductase [Thermoflavimicrobium daqui]